MNQSSLMLGPATQANPAVALAMLAAMRGTGSPSATLYSPTAAAAAATSMYTALPDSTNLAPLISGYYSFPASTSSASPSATAVANSAYNPADVSDFNPFFELHSTDGYPELAFLSYIPCVTDAFVGFPSIDLF